MRTIDKIIYPVNGKRGAPMGRSSRGTKPTDKKVFDCRVPLDNQGAYDRGGAYWGLGSELRVSYTKDLSYIEFYRKEAFTGNYNDYDWSEEKKRWIRKELPTSN